MKTLLQVLMVFGLIQAAGAVDDTDHVDAQAGNDQHNGLSPEQASKGLEIFHVGYPRSFLFWYSTRSLVSNPNLDPQALDQELLKLNGAMSPSSNWEKVVDYKQRHPEKLVLLFTQGHVYSQKQSEYDPVAWSDFYAGHWVYLEGCKITQDLPADRTADVIHVEDASQFRDKRTVADMMICRVGDDGKLDYSMAEQLQLLSVDEKNQTLRVKRGCYDTEPVSLDANRGWAALHAYAGWGYQGGVSWYLNYSPKCPRDKEGNVAADILLEKFTALFEPGGVLHGYDGLEFDAVNATVVRTTKRFDTDGDGLGDNGYENGLNLYGIGHYDFIKRLRIKLGDSKLILGDGLPGARGIRFLGLLNGVEFESWPRFGDERIDDWSSAINFHLFVKQNARPPHFSYINHKVGGESRKRGLEIPLNIHRATFAAAQFLDAAVAVHPTALPKTTFIDASPAANQALQPTSASDHDLRSGIYPVWDEFVKGLDNQKNWLGMPVAPAVRLARAQPDLLNGAGQKVTAEFLKRIQVAGLTSVKEENGAIRISSSNGNPVRFTITDVPCNGDDLFISFNIEGDAMEGYPEDYTRSARLRSSSGAPEQSFQFNSKWFNNCLSFRRVTASSVNLSFELDGDEAVRISDFSVHAHPDAIYRDFENGLVLANPSDHDYEFDLAKIVPGVTLRRLKGSPMQDPKTNSGLFVGEKVTLGPRDGLFLVKQDKMTGGH